MKHWIGTFWMTMILTAAVTGFAQDSKEGLRMVFTDKEAVGMLEGFGTDMIAGPQVIAAEWSASGRYVLAARLDVQLSFKGNRLQLPPPPDLVMPGEASLILWNSSARRSQEVWSKRFAGPQEMVSIEQVAWLSGRDVALAVVRYDRPEADGGEHQRLLLRVEGSRKQAQPIGDLKNGQLLLSPVHPLAVIFSQEEKSLRVLKADGSLSPPAPLPEPNMTIARWSEEGILCLIAGTRPSGFDPRSGEFRPFTEMPKAFAPPASGLLIRIK
ncbi:MAG: hypothetical protein IT210_25320 [Armatimonadetes bacterium]|nr:hypothetical protein [Armatimonadota bacterium]